MAVNPDEFAIIDGYFKPLFQPSAQVLLGPGDDCALLELPPGDELCVSTDTLVGGVHFPADADGALVANRALGASLSDLAAMGATPHACLLALTLPEVDQPWLRDFSQALAGLLDRYRAPLVGGNLCRGHLSLTMTALGRAPGGKAVRRAGARAGDGVYVTATLGDAGRGLELVQSGQRQGYLVSRYCAPSPRLVAGAALRDLATAMIDISDGLVADLRHLCAASRLGARVDTGDLPLSSELVGDVGVEAATRLALFAGDDYELCFTAPPESAGQLGNLARQMALRVTRIGSMTKGDGVVMVDGRGRPMAFDPGGYRHF